MAVVLCCTGSAIAGGLSASTLRLRCCIGQPFDHQLTELAHDLRAVRCGDFVSLEPADDWIWLLGISREDQEALFLTRHVGLELVSAGRVAAGALEEKKKRACAQRGAACRRASSGEPRGKRVSLESWLPARGRALPMNYESQGFTGEEACVAGTIRLLQEAARAVVAGRIRQLQQRSPFGRLNFPNLVLEPIQRACSARSSGHTPQVSRTGRRMRVQNSNLSRAC